MPTATAFAVEVETDWSRARDRWRYASAQCTATPFQHFDCLDAWYSCIAPARGLKPRLVTVTDARSGDLIMLLPLVSVPTRHGATLQFADQLLIDFNAPLLGPVAVAPGAEPRLWQALTHALPGHAAADFRKMPVAIQGRPNPLATIAGACDSSAASNAITLQGTFQSYHQSLDRRVRMELERCWRVLQREPDVVFEVIRDEPRGLAVLDVMDRQQHERLTEIGSPFSLDEPAQQAFYRHRLGERIANGGVVITALSVQGEIIAAQYAVADGHTAVVVRISNAGKLWTRVSPGRLIIHKTLETLVQLGYQVCDLSIGDYDYKRRFGVVRTPLVDMVAAMSWRGHFAATRHRAIGALRARPALDARVRRLALRLGR